MKARPARLPHAWPRRAPSTVPTQLPNVTYGVGGIAIRAATARSLAGWASAAAGRPVRPGVRPGRARQIKDQLKNDASPFGLPQSCETERAPGDGGAFPDPGNFQIRLALVFWRQSGRTGLLLFPLFAGEPFGRSLAVRSSVARCRCPYSAMRIRPPGPAGLAVARSSLWVEAWEWRVERGAPSVSFRLHGTDMGVSEGFFHPPGRYRFDP